MPDGIAIVVSPLIALMKDQVDGLLEKKLPVTFINSSLSEANAAERIARMKRGEFRLNSTTNGRVGMTGFARRWLSKSGHVAARWPL